MSLMDLRATEGFEEAVGGRRFRLPNSTSLMISSVQEKIEQASSPIMTSFTTRSAWMNMPDRASACRWPTPPTLRPSAFSAGGGSLGAAGAPRGVGPPPRPEPRAGVWASTGALANSATAPMRAMMGEVRFVSSICRRFLLDRAH